MPHPNEVLLREVFDAFMRGDRQQAVAFFAEDAVVHYPGPGPLHGDHNGRDGILHFWAEQDRCSPGFRPQVLDLVATDRNIFLFVRIEHERSKTSWLRVVVYEVSGGKIAAARVFEEDSAAAGAFFAREGASQR